MNVTLYIDDKPLTLENVERKSGKVSFTIAGKAFVFSSKKLPDGSFVLEREVSPGVWQRMSGDLWRSGRDNRVRAGGIEAKVAELAVGVSQNAGQAALSPNAPMPGLIRQILVKEGEMVAKGQALVVMEAMKLQITLSAGADAKVDKVLVSEGQMIMEGAELVRLTEIKDKAGS